MSDEVSLPASLSPDAGLDEMRQTLQRLLQWAGAREPLADGAALDKFLTGRAAVGVNLLAYNPGQPGAGGDSFTPGTGTSNPGDASQPTAISGLTVTGGIGFFFIEIDPPNYSQGGGNGRTIIYRANYSGTGPLPTFPDAVEAGTIPGKAVLLVLSAEHGVQAHFWAKAETRHPTLQASPTGGTNGVTATAGKIDGAEHVEALSIGTAQIADLAVTNAKIVSLSVAKLLAGSIGVGEYIQSTGYTGSGVSEWRIDGNGVARFTGVIVSGQVVATSGSIGGINIGATFLRSTNYVAGTSGFTIENDGTAEFGAILLRNASGNVLLNAGATGTALPPWVVGGSSIGGGLDLTTGTNTDNAMELRSMVAGPGIALGYSTTGAVQVASTLPINEEVQLAADESTTTVGITPTNMSLALAINKTYAIRGRLLVRSALATTGHVVGCNVPTSAATVLRVTSQATESTAQQRVLNLPSGGSGTVVFTEHFAATQAAPTVFDSGSSSIIEFDAVVKVGATAGVFELVFGSEVSGSSVTLLAGSSMTAQALKAGVVTASALAGTPAYTTPIEAARATGNSIPATALATISLKRDGTWAATRTGNTSTSGNWASTTSADLGLQWLIKYVPTSGTLSANGAADWTSLSATVTASVSAFSPTGSGILSTKTCTTQIILKNVLTGVETTVGTVTLYAEAESDSDTANP